MENMHTDIWVWRVNLSTESIASIDWLIDWLTNQSNDWSPNQPSDWLLENTWEVFFQYRLVGKYAAEKMEGFVAQHAVSLALSEKIIEKHATVIGNKQKIQMVNFWAWHQYFTSNQLRHYLILQQSCLTLHLATFFLWFIQENWASFTS